MTLIIFFTMLCHFYLTNLNFGISILFQKNYSQCLILIDKILKPFQLCASDGH
jgi:hypothetical protein